MNIPVPSAAKAAAVPATEPARMLLQRWRDRALRWRMGLALPAVAAAIAGGLLVHQQVRVGVGDGPAWTDPVLVGLLASFLGALGAELHLARPAAGTMRAARLAPRDADLYVSRGAGRRRAVLAVLAGTTLAAAALLVGWTALMPGLLAVAVLGLVPVAQQRIATRPQPVLPPDLTAADDTVRRLATRTLDDAGAGAALLLVAWQGSTVGQALPHWWPPLLWGLQLAALVVAVVWWRRSAPRRLLPDAPDAPAGVEPEAVP